MERTLLGGAIALAIFLAVALGRGWFDGPGGSTGNPAATSGEATTLVTLAGPADWGQTTLDLQALRGELVIVGDPDADGVAATFRCSESGGFLGRRSPAPGRLVPSLEWSTDGTRVIAMADPGDGVTRQDAATTLTGSWHITIPASMNVELHTRLGDVTIDGVAGVVSARADVGDVTVFNGTGPTTATTGIGDVDVASTGVSSGSSQVGTVRINGVVQESQTG